jgi:5-oxoprolinase (ATP-hydrolysing) subunit B
MSRFVMLSMEISECGDSSVRLMGTSSDPERNWRLVHHVANWFTSNPAPGFHCAVATYDALLVEFDCVVTDQATVRERIRLAVCEFDGQAPAAEPRHLSVPVVYGGVFGPDLQRVAELLGIPEDDVVDLHASPTYTIRCLGGPVGSPMTDGPAFTLPIPRLDSPRAVVEAGHVSVAGRQATMTPARAPGGWSLLGRTPLQILDLESDQLVPYRPGDTIKYFPIDTAQWPLYEGQRLRCTP